MVVETLCGTKGGGDRSNEHSMLKRVHRLHLSERPDVATAVQHRVLCYEALSFNESCVRRCTYLTACMARLG